MASSVFVRHTLNAVYADLQVELHRVDVQTPSSRVTKATERMEMGGKLSREKSVFIGLCVRGIARVSGGVGEWEV